MDTFDLNRLAERLQSAAGRAEGLTVTTSNTDLIFIKDGVGTNRSEAVPFSALFLQDRDLVGEALNRLQG